MKILIFLFFFFPISIFSQVGESYKSFLHSDFADFFHTAEIKRTPYRNGELREIKTGAFQDYITIYFYTDTVSLTVHEASLEIDRSWIEDESTAEFARDLVKSFLLDLIPAADQSRAMPAGDLLFNRKATTNKFALDLMDVFNNKQDSTSHQFSKCTVVLDNSKKEDKTFFRLRIAEK